MCGGFPHYESLSKVIVPRIGSAFHRIKWSAWHLMPTPREYAVQRLPIHHHYSSAKTSSWNHQKAPKREGEQHATI